MVLLPPKQRPPVTIDEQLDSVFRAAHTMVDETATVESILWYRNKRPINWLVCIVRVSCYVNKRRARVDTQDKFKLLRDLIRSIIVRRGPCLQNEDSLIGL